MENRSDDASSRGSLKVEERVRMNGSRLKREDTSASNTPGGSKMNSRASSLSPDMAKSAIDSASPPDNVAPSKPSRKASQKPVRTPPALFDHLPDATEDACSTFQVIHDCLYGAKSMGSSEHDALDCDCAEDWRGGENHACGEDSDCINRATKIECVSRNCNCGNDCENQRFQRKQYADVSVIKTEKKGFGLRANADLQANDFIFEYIGEVINEATFRNRMLKYDREGIKHFYFMSLTRSEFVDATKKGNLGRFCNHSCNPNCFVDKWVVGDKLRMGIFALRTIRAGEELVFNYNVDRYGADPQPCYCAEPNCTGFIGGKTQTERATKLPLATIEALGIDDGDNWDTAVAKKPRKKKASEDDEDYVNSVQPRLLSEEGVNKVMGTLMQCKEKWIVVKLLARLQAAEGDNLHHRMVKMHGYTILKNVLNAFKDDTNVVLQVLDILYKLPRITKNKISDSNVEAAVQPLVSSEHQDVAFEAKRLIDVWSKLETAYRIPRKKFDPAAPVTINSFEDDRRNMDREEAPPKPAKSFGNVVVPTGPRSSIPQRNNFFAAQRPRKLPTSLPPGWFVTTDSSGKYYFYDKNGNTTWQRPTAPAVVEPKASEKAVQSQKSLQDIIDSLTREPTPKQASHTPRQASTPVPEPKREKWRSLPVEKQMKIYENTLFPHVKYVMDKFSHKLPKEELKKFAREINKKLVSSDYKNNRVDDPTSITPKQEKKVRKYVRDYFEKAVLKYKDHEKRKAERTAKATVEGSSQPGDAAIHSTPTKDETALSDVGVDSPGSTGSDRKRKRDDDDIESPGAETPSETPSMKRVKEDEAVGSPSPPPPPPPPSDPTDTPLTEEPLTEEERSMREQEEALMRENEEAQRLEDEQCHKTEPAVQKTEPAVNGTAGKPSAQSATTFSGGDAMDIDTGEGELLEKNERRKQEVLSH